MRLYDQNVYVNAVGGLSHLRPAGGPGVALAIASDFPRPSGGPSARRHRRGGAVRGAPSGRQLERRVAEAEKLGFGRCLIARSRRNRQLPRPAWSCCKRRPWRRPSRSPWSSRCSAFDEGSALGCRTGSRPRWKRDVDALVNQRALYQRKLMEELMATAGERAGGRIELDLAMC